MVKLYVVFGGPPSICCRMALSALNVPHDVEYVDFNAGEHLNEKFSEMNPQKEIPILDDDGFILGESVAIMQYIGDKFDVDKKLYPTEAKHRALVNHRLCFYSSVYYASICMHIVAPIYYDYSRSPATLHRMNLAIQLLETYLHRTGCKYIAGPTLTLADLPLIVATMVLYVVHFDLSDSPLIRKWYETFQAEHPDLYKLAHDEMHEIGDGYKNPPRMGIKIHHLHPLRKD